MRNVLLGRELLLVFVNGRDLLDQLDMQTIFFKKFVFERVDVFFDLDERRLLRFDLIAEIS